MPYSISFQLERIDFKGSGNAPSMVITGAIHGNEQTGTHTARLVADKLKKERLLGNVTIFPICNENAFKARQRQAPEDNEDLNRIFPGNKNGTHSHQLASHIWEITEGYDYLLDLHCCGIFGSPYTLCCYNRYESHKTLPPLLGIETVVHTSGAAGQLYLESSERRGQSSILIELPGGQPGGVIDRKAAEQTCDKIINYLKLLGIVEGEGVKPDPSEIHMCGRIDRDAAVAGEDGLYEKAVNSGQIVKKNDVIAVLNGQSVLSPIDAVVLTAPVDRYVFKGDSLVTLVDFKEIADEA